MPAAKTKGAVPPKITRLTRSKSDRMIAGVAGGLGEFFGLDSTIFRILFVLLTLGGGAGIVLYIVLWILIPEPGDGQITSETIAKNIDEMRGKVHEMRTNIRNNRHDRNRSTWAIVIILVGIWFLLSNLGVISNLQANLIWPIIIIILGFLLLFRN